MTKEEAQAAAGIHHLQRIKGRKNDKTGVTTYRGVLYCSIKNQHRHSESQTLVSRASLTEVGLPTEGKTTGPFATPEEAKRGTNAYIKEVGMDVPYRWTNEKGVTWWKAPHGLHAVPEDPDRAAAAAAAAAGQLTFGGSNA